MTGPSHLQLPIRAHTSSAAQDDDNLHAQAASPLSTSSTVIGLMSPDGSTMETLDMSQATESRIGQSPSGRVRGSEPQQDADPGAASDSDQTVDTVAVDPYSLGQHKRGNVTRRQMKKDYPTGNSRNLKQFYTRQNELIDQFLNCEDEERLQVLDDEKNGPRVKFAVNASFAVNFCLFIIQLYAAVSTGSLSLFATAADAFMDLVSSTVMFITSRMAARPSIYKYPVGRTRIETIGIILFCALMTTVAVQLIIESARRLGEDHATSDALHVVPIICVSLAIFAKFCLFCYCFAYRRYPAAHVFFIDHRNDLFVNVFGLVMSIVGERYVWFLDPVGAICIGLLILVSWVSNAFEQVWLLVGKAAPHDFIAKVVYMTITHDEAIRKIETCRAYHAGQRFYVEVDVVMDADAPLKVTHDVAQTLQRKLEGLADVERAFVHVDYEDEHDIKEEHKPLYAEQKPRRTFKEVITAVRKKVLP